MKRYYLAIDIGASSGRHILGSVENGRYVLEEIYRFSNGATMREGHLCWDYDAIFSQVVEGLSRCYALGKIPETIGIDTWGLDYVLLDKNGNRIGLPVAYRDERTSGMEKIVADMVTDDALYRRTGIQKMTINTIYQLAAQRHEHPEELEKAEFFLMVPDYLNYMLTGRMCSEYTNATTTALVGAESKKWDYELIQELGYPEKSFLPLSMPGTVIGSLKEEIAAQVGFQTKVILPATHDTGSAFLAVPAKDDNSVYISSGTWSLMGVENSAPITDESSRLHNFTNEGGYQYRYRYLKNIMGLWIIQSIRHETNDMFSFSQMEAMARAESEFPSIVPVNDARFLAPENMSEEICAACRESGQPTPKNMGQIVQCAYRSLAECYRDTIKELETVTEKKYTSINVVGGGSKDSYLNELTAHAAGLPLCAGPAEGTAIGNLIVQMIHDGTFADLAEARSAIRPSFEMKEFQP